MSHEFQQVVIGTPVASEPNTVPGQMARSVQPAWCVALPIQQQSVLFLGARGPDGIAKSHPVKRIQRAYRACVLVAAKYGRCLEYGEKADTFMCLKEFANDAVWDAMLNEFFETADSLPHHFYMHLIHGAEILGYKHPDPKFRERWHGFYRQCVKDFHLNHETEQEMDARLSDWGRQHWKMNLSEHGGEQGASQVSPKSTEDLSCIRHDKINCSECFGGFNPSPSPAVEELLKDRERLDYILRLIRKLEINKLPVGNFYLPETREGIDAGRSAIDTARKE